MHLFFFSWVISLEAIPRSEMIRPKDMNVFMALDKCYQISPGLPSFCKGSLYLVYKLQAKWDVPGREREVTEPHGVWFSPGPIFPLYSCGSPAPTSKEEGRAGKGCGHPGKWSNHLDFLLEQLQIGGNYVPARGGQGRVSQGTLRTSPTDQGWRPNSLSELASRKQWLDLLPGDPLPSWARMVCVRKKKQSPLTPLLNKDSMCALCVRFYAGNSGPKRK